MLSGIVGVSVLAPLPLSAADLVPAISRAPASQPAVDGVNWKFAGFGGSISDRGVGGALGSVAVPLGGHYGFQLDGALGALDSRFFGATGAHLFWRNPAQGLLGIYASYTHWNKFSGLDIGQIAAEAEVYFGPFTIQGIAGVEFGNSTSGIVGSFLQTYDVKTRFFDKINFAYYLNDNLKVFLGHRYLGGQNALALGGEWAFPINGPTMGAAFIEGRIGENDFQGIWVGLRIYYGQKNKTLIQRHRQDDPIEWTPVGLYTGVNSASQIPISGKPCPPGEQLVGGVCVFQENGGD